MTDKERLSLAMDDLGVLDALRVEWATAKEFGIRDYVICDQDKRTRKDRYSSEFVVPGRATLAHRTGRTRIEAVRESFRAALEWEKENEPEEGSDR